MNDPIETRLRETAWRRKLTAAEEAELRSWLLAHPEAAADWENDARLNRVLERLQEVPVATNFTERVMQAISRETQIHRASSPFWSRFWWVVLPRAAVVVVIACSSGFAYREFIAARQASFARSVAEVSEIASLPDPEVLQDFEAIRQLSSTPRPDRDLLTLLQ